MMALKTTLAAGLVAFTMALLPTTAAEAKTNIYIGIGTGGWAQPCWNRYGRRCGWRPGHSHFYYAPHRRPGVYYNFSYGYPYYPHGYRNVYRRPYVAPVAGRMSCASARNMVDNNGFNRVRARECRGSVYTFQARRHGRNFVVKVNAHSRRIIGVGGI